MTAARPPLLWWPLLLALWLALAGTAQPGADQPTTSPDPMTYGARP